jgi:chromate transporter
MEKSLPAPLSTTELVAIFVRTGSLAFGGGASTLAMLHDEFCVRRPVVSEEEFQVLWGLTRLLPGMNLLSLTVMLGYRTAGLLGSILALAGLTVPSFAIIILGCVYLRRGVSNPAVVGAVRGLSVGAAALLIYTGWQMCQASIKPLGRRSKRLWMGMAVLGTVLMLWHAVNPAFIVVGGGVLGVLLSGWAGGAAQ